MNSIKKVLSVFALVWLTSAAAVGQSAAFITKVERHLESLAEHQEFSLSITIAGGEAVLLEKAFGYANREHQVVNQVDTRFNIASIGKLFTAVSILQLMDKGKVELGQTLGNYLPDFPNQFIKDSVTIHQLLTHSSGLPLWFDEQFDSKPKFEFAKINDYLSLYEKLEINNSKIGKYNYSNAGYITLGFIIEAVSEMTFKEYLNQHIFKPLQMNESNLWQLTEIIPNVANGYIRPAHEDDAWKTNFHLNKGSSPAGGAYASTGDLIRFFIGLNSDRLLKPETKALMFSPQIETFGGHYGYGIALHKNNDQLMMGHLGGYYGVRGELMWYKDANLIVAILANSDQTDYVDVSYFIKTELTGTDKEKEAYKNTMDLIGSTVFEQVVSGKVAIDSLTEKGFDESLIQIKGYFLLQQSGL